MYCGYLATIAAGLITYPLDTIRRRQMITGEMNLFTVDKDMVYLMVLCGILVSITLKNILLINIFRKNGIIFD